MLCSNCQKIALRTKTAQASGFCSYCTPHYVNPRPRKGAPTTAQYVTAAAAKYPNVHIKADARVKPQADGAYVQAWVWVTSEEAC